MKDPPPSSLSNPPTTSNIPSSTRSNVWPTPQPHTRRDLSPIQTSFTSTSSRSALASAPRNPWAPATHNSLLTSNRQPSSSPPNYSGGAILSPQPGLQQSHPTSLLAGPRPRSNLSAPGVISSSGAGANSSGGSTKNFRASPSLPQTNYSSPSTPANAGTPSGIGQGGISGIIDAQFSILLNKIDKLRDDKDKSKRDTEVEKIHQLVAKNGMEAYKKLFRRLVRDNAPHIFGPSRNSERAGNYQLLVEEIQKVTQDPLLAGRIVETVDTEDETVFKDFDLSTFLEHFKMNPLQKITLASAFKRSTKTDLRTKADAIITNNFGNFIKSITSIPQEDGPDETDLYATVIDRLAQNPPRNWTSEPQQVLQEAFETRYRSLNIPVPPEISSTLHQFELLRDSTVVQAIKKAGTKATETPAATNAVLDLLDARDVRSPAQIACAILFMVISREEPPYKGENFITALRAHPSGENTDWSEVVRSFDRQGLRITPDQFKGIYDALLPIAQAYDNFDLQLLWGGDWRHESTQLSFVAAFLSFSEEEIDASKIPGLRAAYIMDDFVDAPSEIRTFAETVVRHPFVSLDATKALFKLVFQDNPTYDNAKRAGVVDNVVNANIPLYVASATAVPKPWGPMHELALRMLVDKILERTSGTSPEHNFALHLVWKRDQVSLVPRITSFYEKYPLHLDTIFNISNSLGWTERLIAEGKGMSIDLAAFAHGRGVFDLDDWLHSLTQAMPREAVLQGLGAFLEAKFDNGIGVLAQTLPVTTTPLMVRTAYAFLTFLGEQGLSENDRVRLQRSAISAYPRLVNFGEGFDDIIEANGADGHQILPEADRQMTNHLTLLVNGQEKVELILELLHRCKTSQNPVEQDLFAAMIWGLFDEFPTLHEYPEMSLANTAVLFGAIIKIPKLLSQIAVQVAISMVLDGLQNYGPDEMMFKFGLQALVHFQDRLVEWPRLRRILSSIPGIRDTEVDFTLQRIGREEQESADEEPNGKSDEGVSADDFLAPDPTVNDFHCLYLEPHPYAEYEGEPDSAVQDAVLFALNNVSGENLTEKTSELATKVRPEHYRWFATFLVGSRIKTQPNLHALYMDMLNFLDSSDLWDEIIRETLGGSIKMLNAETTRASTSERTLLKNLAVWLGQITLGRNQSIRYQNIPFCQLLLEGNETDRLQIVVLFTCKVLAAVAQSDVFKPPCAWTMEILSVLAEIYNFVAVKVVVKFEIEVLCRDLEVDLATLAPTQMLRADQTPAELPLSIDHSDHMDSFNDLSLMNIHRPAGMSASIAPRIPELSSILRHNYSLNGLAPEYAEDIKRLLEGATERAVAEIAAAVVERSVTIATISTTQLIQKDFALEPDVEKLRASARSAGEALSGSLAAVTCKEPLRNTMMSNITNMRNELPEHVFPNGSVHMFVNDNIEAVCGIVQELASSASYPEVEAQLADVLQLRQDADFGRKQVSRWANYIPSPYKLSPSGLNEDQLAIYEDFRRTSRGGLLHSTLSMDDGRQDLADQFQPTFPASVDTGILSLPASQIPAHVQPRLNGYANGNHHTVSIGDLVDNIADAARKAIEQGQYSRPIQAPQVEDAWNHLKDGIAECAAQPQSQLDLIYQSVAHELLRVFHGDRWPIPVLDLLAEILRYICQCSEGTEEVVVTFCGDHKEERLYNAPTTAALVRVKLIEMYRLDAIISAAMQLERPGILQFLSAFVDEMLMAEPPFVLRANLAKTFTTLADRNATGRGTPQGQVIMQRLSAAGSHSSADDRQDQMNYVFDEWVELVKVNDSPVILALFVQQLHVENILGTEELLAAFLKVSIQSCIEGYERDETPRGLSSAHNVAKSDALAKMLAVLVNRQIKINGAAKSNKLEYLEKVLTLLVLVFVERHHNGPFQIKDLFQRTLFRIFTSLIDELRQTGNLGSGDYTHEPLLAVGNILKRLPPSSFPSFAFAWTSLICNRHLMPFLLINPIGESLYFDLVSEQLSYTGHLLNSPIITDAAREYYRASLKVLLVLHHDYQDALAKYAFELLKSVPPKCVQLKSLIISACPSALHELPDPSTEGLTLDHVERMDEAQQPPALLEDFADFDRALEFSGLRRLVEAFLNERGNPKELIDNIMRTVCNNVDTKEGLLPSVVDINLLHGMLIFIVRDAEARKRQMGLLFTFGRDSPAAKLIVGLTERFEPEALYHWLGAMANNLRYPNSHTIFFCRALLHLFHEGATDSSSSELQQAIVRVLMERIVVHRPHPWGIIFTIVELMKNSNYRLFDVPYVKTTPDLLAQLLAQMGLSQPASRLQMA